MSESNSINTILVIEDDRDIRWAIKTGLETEGYNVVTAANGKEGLEKIVEVPKPCLVLLDFMMPIMNGREFLNVVMKDTILAPIPVIIVSASVGQQSTEGSVKVLKKPIDLNELLRIVAHYTTKIQN